MRRVVDLLWEELHDTGISWAGFYILTEAGDLVLGPRRDKPACSPIGLHGVCGQALSAGRPRIVRDVRELGGSYIACDPRDRSEVVVPCRDAGGRCWGVLDLDSHEVGAFDGRDADGLERLLRASGLTV